MRLSVSRLIRTTALASLGATVICRLGLVAVALAVLGDVQVAATSYAPVTFNELVARADVIFIGEVVDVRPFSMSTREGDIIKTRVVFRVSDPLWGTTSAVEVFDFFGGTLNGLDMAIADMPRFAVGDRRVVFARRERSINPIVGFTQGLLQISRDGAGVDRVSMLSGVPLARPESIGSQPRLETTSVQPMRLSDLRERIRAALAARR